MGDEEQDPVEESPVGSSTDHDERGRISALLYLGAALVAFSGLLYAMVAAAVTDGRPSPEFASYAPAAAVLGFALALVGLARQAKRMVD